jgi:hypothetical protein
LSRQRIGSLFCYDFDSVGFGAHAQRFAFDRAGFDLFSFPSNVGLIGFDLRRFAAAQARRGRHRGWAGVVSAQEQFGALAAALVAEQLGLPGTAPEAVLKAQHKLLARQILEQVAPEANLGFTLMEAEYGDPIPEGLRYPAYVKPLKAAFSVLARRVDNAAQLHRHTRFGWRELWVIRRLVEPFEQVMRERLPGQASAHRMLLEEPVPASVPQFNLDGWVFGGQTHALGVVDAIMYPGTQAFMRWQFPSKLPADVQTRALDVARRFLQAIGFTHGLFNMEFFYDAAADRLAVIEFNPRLASQFSDLYQRVLGTDPHAMALELALGRDPADAPRHTPRAGAAASLVYRVFSATQRMPMAPSAARQAAARARHPDALIYSWPKSGHSLQRDFKWLGNYRHGIVHLDGRDEQHLRERALHISGMLGWMAPYADQLHAPAGLASASSLLTTVRSE